ncbi:MAG: CrcB family protein [Nitriliruptoraceae bacterium]|nr:CrcB family protein [Nitriliruptoraceae bacterium]
MNGLVLIVLGVPVAGACGSLVRNEVTLRAGRRWTAGRAIATAVVNLVGSAVMATLVGLNLAGRVPDELVVVLGFGFAGSLTTFSTWVVEAVRAGTDGERPWPLIGGVELLGQLLLGVGVAALVLALLR